MDKFETHFFFLQPSPTDLYTWLHLSLLYFSQSLDVGNAKQTCLNLIIHIFVKFVLLELMNNIRIDNLIELTLLSGPHCWNSSLKDKSTIDDLLKRITNSLDKSYKFRSKIQNFEFIRNAFKPETLVAIDEILTENLSQQKKEMNQISSKCYQVICKLVSKVFGSFWKLPVKFEA